MNQTEYRIYLLSESWKQTRLWKLTAVNWTCERCGFRAFSNHARKFLQVHHLTYERLHHERLDDLEALCMHCHEYEHGLRAEPGQGTDPDMIPAWVADGEGHDLPPLGCYPDRYCRPECPGCQSRPTRWQCRPWLPGGTVEEAVALLYSREPGRAVGYHVGCGMTVYNCQCGDCRLQWTLDGGGGHG